MLGHKKGNPGVGLWWHHLLHQFAGWQSDCNSAQSKRTHQKDHHPNWRLGKINSKLLYATIGIPNGCSLLSPIIATIAAQPKMHHYKDCTIQLNQAAKQALTNWQTLLATTSHAAAHPMHGPYSCPDQLWWLLWCIQSGCRWDLGGPQPGPSTYCLASSLPTQNPSGSRLWIKPMRSNLQLRSGNDGLAPTMACAQMLWHTPACTHHVLVWQHPHGCMGHMPTINKSNQCSQDLMYPSAAHANMSSITNDNTTHCMCTQHNGRLCIQIIHLTPGPTHLSHHFPLALPPPTGCFLDSLLPTKHSDWVHLIHSVNANIQSGVVVLTLKTREPYCSYWKNFLPANINLLLQHTDQQTHLLLLQVFIKQVQQGDSGCRHKVKTGSIQAVLGAITKTIKLTGFDNPLHQPRTTNYYAALTLQTETYQHNDHVLKNKLPSQLPSPTTYS